MIKKFNPICYLLTACLKRFSGIDGAVRRNRKVWFIISILVQIVLMYLGIQIGGLLCYFYGYYIKHEESPEKSTFMVLTVIMLLSTALRFLVYKHSHESAAYNIIFTWSFIALGIWLSLLGMLICVRFSEKSFHIATSKAWRFLDLAFNALYVSKGRLIGGKMVSEQFVLTIIAIYGAFDFRSCCSDANYRLAQNNTYHKKRVGQKRIGVA